MRCFSSAQVATELTRKADDSGWDLLVAPCGMVDFTLREINDRTDIALGDIVPFWRGLGKGDNWHYFTHKQGLVVVGVPYDGDVLQYNGLYDYWEPVAPYPMF